MDYQSWPSVDELAMEEVAGHLESELLRERNIEVHSMRKVGLLRQPLVGVGWKLSVLLR